jgi:hypothetical protein
MARQRKRRTHFQASLTPGGADDRTVAWSNGASIAEDPPTNLLQFQPVRQNYRRHRSDAHVPSPTITILADGHPIGIT